MKYDLTQFIYEGVLEDKLRIGNDISKIIGAILWMEQEGNIPALYQVNLSDLVKVYVSCISNVIVGVSIKTDDNEGVLFYISDHGNIIELNSDNSDFSHLLKFFNNNNISWSFDNIDTGDKSVGVIVNSKVKLMHCFDPGYWGFYQCVIFDHALYNKLAGINP